jgi:hypothetical protein
LEEKTELSEQDREASFLAIHQTLKTLLEAHPTSVSVLRSVLCEKFPHKVFPTPVQASFIRQLLFLTGYVPSLRKDALELIIDKIVQIDVCVFCQLTRPHLSSREANGDQEQNTHTKKKKKSLQSLFWHERNRHIQE